jgi:hypothetical protein
LINLPKLNAVHKAVTTVYPAAEGHWGIFVLCWGGKIAVLASEEGNHGVGR